MVDLIYFLICVFGMCFFCILLGHQIGVKDGYKKAKIKYIPMIELADENANFYQNLCHINSDEKMKYKKV